MKKFFKILLWVVIGILFIGTFVFLYLNSKSETVEYAIVSPENGTIEKTTVLTGKIEPRDEINIKPQISGIITEINVEPGDVVKEGDIIAKIKVIPEASSLSSAMSRVESAKISLDDAKSKFDRNKQLYDKKIISKEEFETSQTAWQQAVRELDAANDAYNIVRDGVSKHNAKESNTLVRATIGGIILDVPVKVGSSVIQANTFNDGTTVATIADMTNLIFKGKVDETEVGQLRVGMPMTIAIGAMPELAPKATIEYIAPKGVEENGTNTFEIKAALEIDSVGSLRSGYSANATVTLSSSGNVLTVPESVVEFAGDSTFVYILTDSTSNEQQFKKISIITGNSDGIKIEVKEGIDSLVRLRGDLIKNN
ncbi:MAG: efflux RND transporter periplasmic adaptor subunit [Paramuribaculum sp.]|nr:efflux RND transporter periplasmic adaptor subunit [Paramuribaculum sp.]MDE5836680.1 efflux RND transporter periplasmic adaptor subunit [Paramuribaculum sp.]